MIQLDTHCTQTQLLKLRLDMNSTGGYCLAPRHAELYSLIAIRIKLLTANIMRRLED